MPALLDLRMPGVYTQEVETLGSAPVNVLSAVPVFIGYTEKAERKGESLTGKAIRVKSMKEFEDWYGGAKEVAIQVTVDNREDLAIRPEVRINEVEDLQHSMHYAMQMYYANGGGPCFILSVGGYGASPSQDELGDEAVFKTLQKARDVTILVFPDGPGLGLTAYTSVIEQALIHCEKMKNRVTVIDVPGGEDLDLDIQENATAFQTAMPADIDFKKYGMAYYPYLDTGLGYSYDPAKVIIVDHLDDSTPALKTATEGVLDKVEELTTAERAEATAKADAEFLKAMQQKDMDGDAFTAEEKDKLPTAVGAAIDATGDVAGAFITAVAAADAEVVTKEGETTNAEGALDTSRTAATTAGLHTGESMADIMNISDVIYNKIRDAIRAYSVKLSPSSAIAGVYVRNDATQGPWKAPANTSVFGIVQPSIELDDDDHGALNAPDNGKAINVIRAYPGRGNLVYGARTLAGNSFEWRYVSVRRTFCFIEDTIGRSMLDYVFAPNTPQTWIKVRATINAFLNRLWKAGGLYGATPEDAYEVLVGEPETMSTEDVLSGIMRIVIRVAVARPAEFIVLQYEHKFELGE